MQSFRLDAKLTIANKKKTMSDCSGAGIPLLNGS